MTAQQQILIKGYTFTLSQPYEAGHPLTAGEAKALNDLRKENIQNNFRQQVNDQIKAHGKDQLLPQATLEALQAILTEYDAGYSFNDRASRVRIGDIDREIIVVATERAKAQESSGALPETIEFLVSEFVKLPAVIEEARARVAARRSALSGGMEDL